MANSLAAKRLRQLRKIAGYGVREFAREIDMPVQKYGYYEDPARFKKDVLPIALARTFGGYLLGRGDPEITPNQIAELAGVEILPGLKRLPEIDETLLPMALPAARPSPSTQVPAPQRANNPDVPVWASASAGDDGTMILTAEPIDYIRRSELMRDVKDPFAFYVIGDSMSDVIEQGDQVVINPSRPPQLGKDHVFIQDDGKGTMLALVKRLLKSSATHWRVRQYNPPKDFDLPKSKWAKALRITEKRYG